MAIELKRVREPWLSSELIQFLRDNVNPVTSAETVAWQFQRIPSDPVLIVATEDERPICTQSFLPHTLHVGKAEVSSVKSEHSFLLPKYRGTPVFTDAYAMGLQEAANSGRSICWGFTPAVKVWRDRLKFEVNPTVMYECKSLIGLPSISRPLFQRRTIRSLWDVMRYSKATFRNVFRHGSLKEFVVTEKIPTDAQIGQLIADRGGADIVRLKMDEAFVRWRILENPNLRYVVRSFERDGRLRGYFLVALSKRSAQPIAHLSEFLFLEKVDGIAMLDLLVKELAAIGCNVVHYFGNQANAVNRQVFELLASRLATEMTMSKAMALVVKRDRALFDHDVSAWYINGLWTQGFDR
jgi:hypothetical protein